MRVDSEQIFNFKSGLVKSSVYSLIYWRTRQVNLSDCFDCFDGSCVIHGPYGKQVSPYILLSMKMFYDVTETT